MSENRHFMEHGNPMPELTLTPLHSWFYSHKRTKNLDSGLTLYFSPKQRVGIGGGGGGGSFIVSCQFFSGGRVGRGGQLAVNKSQRNR
jgi:hypothetical protein